MINNEYEGVFSGFLYYNNVKTQYIEISHIYNYYFIFEIIYIVLQNVEIIVKYNVKYIYHCN